MTLYALDDIGDAVEATRAFLFPFELGRWARLALVVFFIGGVGGANPFQYPGGSSGPSTDPSSGPGTADVVPTLGATELAIIAGVLAVIAFVVLVFMLVGSIMEFVFVESLRREDVTIRRYWAERWTQGLRLFGFRLALALVSLGIVAGLALLVIAPMLLGDATISFALLVPAILVILAVLVVGGLLEGFTTGFVVPIMIREDAGVLAAWRRFWPTLTGQWEQYAVYVLTRFGLQIAVGILAGIATLLAVLALAIPLVILGVVGVAVLSVAGLPALPVIVIGVLVFVLGIIVISLLVGVPVQTFLRYYALFVLGDTNDAFDVIADRRRAVRS